MCDNHHSNVGNIGFKERWDKAQIIIAITQMQRVAQKKSDGEDRDGR